MKGMRFYLEYATKADKRKGKHLGRVFAAFVDVKRFDGCYEGLGSIFEQANSPVAITAAHWRVMNDRFKRIREEEAREIHPNLFKVLDQE